MAALVNEGTAGTPPPDDRSSLTLALLAAQLPVRDLAWAMISRERAADHVRLWSQGGARTPAPDAAPALCLLGMAAWVQGDGALMNCCADRVAVLDPDYSMAAPLRDISARALPPSLWDDLAAGIRQELAGLAG